MLEINGLKFAKNDREFTDSLFEKDGTAYGFYKVSRRKAGKHICITLSDMQGEVFAAIIASPDYASFVNAGKLENGKTFYQYDISSHKAELLGVPSGYVAGIEYARQVAAMV